MESVVYIDVLFLINFAVNILILYLTARIMKNDVSLLRLSLGAALGALYACIMFFPALGIFYSLFAKILFSALLVAVTYNIQNIKAFLKMLAVFYLVSFSFGGAGFAFLFFTDFGTVLGALVSNGEVYLNLPAGLLMLALGTAYGSVILFSRFCRQKYEKERIIMETKIKLADKDAKIKALVDTGNSLVDPVSKKSVMVVEFEALKNILPQEIGKIYISKEENDLKVLLKAMEKLDAAFNLRIIPFSAIGVESGVMLGFLPDEISYEKEGEVKSNFDVVVGICNGKLSEEDEYDALLSPEVFCN